MNVLIKYFIVFVSLLISISFVNSVSYNVCGVSIDEPNFKVQNLAGQDIFIVDNQGDMYFAGRDHVTNNKNTLSSFSVNDLFFNSVTSNFNVNNFNQLSNNLDNSSSLLFQNSSGSDVSSISNSGVIKTSGLGAFQESQATCAADGLYCNGAVLENRDYFCDILGDKSGSCNSRVISSENCLTKLSVESDAGFDPMNFGTVSDYTGCASSACSSSSFSDVCQTSVNLLEYSSTGTGVTSSVKTCTDYEIGQNYCVGNDQIWKKNYNCGSGSCNQNADTLVQLCSVTATQYGTTYCSGNDVMQAVTNFTPTCGGASCSETSNTVQSLVQSCVGEQYCGTGSCLTYSYSWKTSAYGACSATCGGGTQTRTTWCENNLGTVVADTKCTAPKPTLSQTCNTQACSFDGCGGGAYCNWVGHNFYYPSAGGAQNLCDIQKAGTTATYTTKVMGYYGCGGCLTTRGWNGAGWASGCWASCGTDPVFSSITCTG